MTEGAVDFLCSAIGRGHPAYLDGIIACLPAGNRGRVTDVFAVSRGASLAAWRLVELLYRLGGHAGFRGLYGLLRAGAAGAAGGPFLRLLGRDIRREFRTGNRPLVVSHALLVRILRDRANLCFQHAELCAPQDSLVTGDHTIFVPDEAVARTFAAAGQLRERILVTGLCVEPRLVALAAGAFDQRMAREAADAPLTGGFFSSGAEPPQHVAVIVAAALSSCANGGRSILFARKGGRLHKAALRAFRRAGCRLEVAEEGRATGAAGGTGHPESAGLRLHSTRAGLDEQTAAEFMKLDYVVSPAHERTNWAVGLGLPLLMVGPDIGTFAPLNRVRMLAGGVALGIDPASAANAGEWLKRLRSGGQLQRMARRGWGRHPINGFERIAAYLSIFPDPPVTG